MIEPFTKIQSRSLWYSLLFYHCRNDHDIPDELWKVSREFILTVLKGQDYVELAKIYIQQFDSWKERDFQSLLLEMATLYAQVLDLKETIEASRDANTIREWQESYQELLQKIRTAASRLHALSTMEGMIVEIQRKKRQYVYDMLHRAYWDMLEEELEKQETAILQSNLHELSAILVQIPPQIEDQIFSVSEVEQMILDKTFGKTEARELFHRCMSFLKHWDSVEHQRIYDDALQEIDLPTEVSWSKWIRMLMEICTWRATDLLTRKRLWKILLQTESQ